MDLLSARQKLVASNIAHVETPGYKTQDVDFQFEFMSLAKGEQPQTIEPDSLKAKPDGNNVNLHFPLDRVMDWRRTRARMDEAKLEQLYAEIRGIEARQAELNGERTESEKALLDAPSVTGLQLAELDAFQRFTVAEQGRLERRRVECGQRVAAQIQMVAAKRRDRPPSRTAQGAASYSLESGTGAGNRCAGR